MSVHTSLRSQGRAGAAMRNVLKRHERVRWLMEQGRWVTGQSALGLPKIKQLKVKVRKAAKEEKPADAGAEAAPPSPAAAPAGKQAPAAEKKK